MSPEPLREPTRLFVSYEHYTFSSFTEGSIEIRDIRWMQPKGMYVAAREWDVHETLGRIPKGWSQWLRSTTEPVQLVAIGAGLDDTALFAQQAALRPVIIDPMNTEFLQQGLDQLSKKTNVPQMTQVRIEGLLHKISIIQNPSLVWHIPMTFEAAMSAYADQLIGSADIVMDFEGASMYGDLTHRIMRRHDIITQAQRTLLRPDGLQQHWYSNLYDESSF